jgi:hypothetical protein
MHAELCPLCSGKIDPPGVTCRGCNGRGWVEVRDDTPPSAPLPYWPQPYNPYYPSWPGSPMVVTW